MNVYIRTDLECIAGVVSFPEYCIPGPNELYPQSTAGRYYDRARQLAMHETNAAIEGLLDGGATDILVQDGHGYSALDLSTLHPWARAIAGMPLRAPAGLDDSFDAAVMLGQHAMSNTDGGHLCHSGTGQRDQWLLDGRPIGEIGVLALMCGHFGVPVIMISGDAAACAEARALLPGIETVEVMVGEKRGSTRGMTLNEMIRTNVTAIHLSPHRSRQMIREAAQRCLKNIGVVQPYRPPPPYELLSISRPDEQGAVRREVTRADNAIDLINGQLPPVPGVC